MKKDNTWIMFTSFFLMLASLGLTLLLKEYLIKYFTMGVCLVSLFIWAYSFSE